MTAASRPGLARPAGRAVGDARRPHGGPGPGSLTGWGDGRLRAGAAGLCVCEVGGAPARLRERGGQWGAGAPRVSDPAPSDPAGRRAGALASGPRPPAGWTQAGPGSGSAGSIAGPRPGHGTPRAVGHGPQGRACPRAVRSTFGGSSLLEGRVANAPALHRWLCPRPLPPSCPASPAGGGRASRWVTGAVPRPLSARGACPSPSPRPGQSSVSGCAAEPPGSPAEPAHGRTPVSVWP